jgi:hypothetical protein
MRRVSLMVGIGIAAACVAGSASARPLVNLTGTYTCVQGCRDGMIGAPAFVTQNGDEVNLTTETGTTYKAVPDWNAPNRRLWIDARDESVVYSPDGMQLQFDDGRVWQRELPPVVVQGAPAVYIDR